MITIDTEFKSLIPYLLVDEYEQLEKNLLEEKNPETIVLTTWNGVLIDGHHRYEICQKHNIPFKVVEKQFSDRNDVKLWMIHKQLGGRNLSDYSKGKLSLIATKILEEKAKKRMVEVSHPKLDNKDAFPDLENQHIKNNVDVGNHFDEFEPNEIVYEGDENHPPKPKAEPINRIKEAAKMSNISTGNISKIKKIEEKAAPEVKKELEEGKKSINEVYKEIKREEARAEQQIKQEELKERVVELPKDKYNVIYADPPWDIGSFVLDKWESPLEDKYPTMSPDELKRMDILNICAEDCVLFMWSTLTTIPQALELLNTWGFKYHILLTWDKGNGWSSTGFHRRTEVILVGYKGKITNVITQSGKFIPTMITEPKREHSKKPEVMYNLLLSNTIGKRIELFAREKREGFEVYGNEV